MKYKAYLSKSIAALLCIMAITISFNIYLSYKDLYLSNNLSRDYIIYTAAAKTSLENSTISTNDTARFSIKSEKVSKAASIISSNKKDITKKIFVNIFILFISFISLASVHNYVLNVEKTKKYCPKNHRGLVINRKANIKSSSSISTKEGV